MVRVCCVLSLSSIVCVRWKKKENFQPTNKKLNKLQCYLAAAKGSFVFLLLQIRWRKNFRFVSEQKFSTFFFKLKVRSSFFAASSCERANFFLLHLSASSSIKSSSSSSSSGFAASWKAHKNKKTTSLTRSHTLNSSRTQWKKSTWPINQVPASEKSVCSKQTLSQCVVSSSMNREKELGKKKMKIKCNWEKKSWKFFGSRILLISVKFVELRFKIRATHRMSSSSSSWS